MFTELPDDTGVVFRKTLGHYTVHSQGRELDCSLSSLIHKQLIFPTADPTSLRHTVQEVREIHHVDPIAIGDRVRFVEAGDERGVIVEVLPRDSKLSRPAPVPGQRVFEQVIVANADLIPTGASQPLIKPRSIDDVPILALTLSSSIYDRFTLRRVAAQLTDQIKEVTDVSEVKIIGGQRRQIRVLLNEARMSSRGPALTSAGRMSASAPRRKDDLCVKGALLWSCHPA